MTVVVVVLGAAALGLLALFGVPVIGILDSMGVTLGLAIVVIGLVAMFALITYLDLDKSN